MSGFLQLALSAFLGVLVGVAVQWWKSNRDELRILCDEFCRTASDAADLASRYWLTDSKHEDNKINEARLLGMQTRLDGYRVLASHSLGEQENKEIEKASVDFFATITGGEFKSRDRLSDTDRITDSQTRGSALILAVRQGFYRSMHLQSIFGRAMRRTRVVAVISNKISRHTAKLRRPTRKRIGRT